MISIFDLFKIGIGPSSSHTVGPMKSANLFLQALKDQQLLSKVDSIKITLYGSLGATGKGHSSDIAVILGLMGEEPQTLDVKTVSAKIQTSREQQKLRLNEACGDCHEIDFIESSDLIFKPLESLPYHPNALTIEAFCRGESLYQDTYYSIGGGFVQTQQEAENIEPVIQAVNKPVPYPFANANQLLDICETHHLSIADVVRANELANISEADFNQQLHRIWQVMQDCVNDGCQQDGILPGGLQVPRRAKAIYQQLSATDSRKAFNDALAVMDWVNLYALAVNEENASGGRIVTAPTNGAAGVVPAVLHYYRDFCPNYHLKGMEEFLLTAAAIGIVIKENASISGAEVGCQGEVGSACAMAAAGLTHVLGGTPRQCANAAEIGIEHHLGLTCDPIAGLVQVPCIERNAMAAVKAINASRLALKGNGHHVVSLDKAIKTMQDTGRDMMSKYKETSMGGLAINVMTDSQDHASLIPMIDVTVNYSQC
ncbi:MULTISPECIES: L-serine ammonia-lyase [unclassified Moraxella]|uniref:L-serine ammonia-lyase n=1 Tax=unclassified Moraxella TaxID=2685852 RepID=UPI003AF9C9D8